MKLLFLLILSVVGNACYCQTQPFDTLLNRAKAQFKPDLEKPDYSAAMDNLNKALKLRSNDTEALYFLGYAISRFNSSDGETIPQMKMPLVLKASDALERVIKISPLYKGKTVVLDPYSKITSEWGALALSYLANNKPDSALWAFQQGKNRGGFDEFILAINRDILEGCSKNALLISSGDNYTFPMYYLQTVEKLRCDISMLDLGLLTSYWYPRFIEKTTSVRFGIREPNLDTINYIVWKDTVVSIPVSNTSKTFDWHVKPSYQDGYLLRADRILLSLLMENKFRRDVFFTKGFPENENLSLDSCMRSYVLLDKLNSINEPQQTNHQFIQSVKKINSTFKYVNPYSEDELTPVDCIRSQIFTRLDEAQKANWVKESRELKELLDDYFPVKVYPVYTEDMKKCYDYYGMKY